MTLIAVDGASSRLNWDVPPGAMPPLSKKTVPELELVTTKWVSGPSYPVGPLGPGPHPNVLTPEALHACEASPVNAPSPSKPKMSGPARLRLVIVAAELLITPTKESSAPSYGG